MKTFVVAHVGLFTATCIQSAWGWTTVTTITNAPKISKHTTSSKLSNSHRDEYWNLKASSIAEDDVLSGVQDFERWFSAIPGADCTTAIRHDCFGSLRGLAINNNNFEQNGNVMTIPKSIVLYSDFGQSDWDAKLAEQLWLEVLQGPSSSIYGYTSLLTTHGGWTTKNLPNLPPPAAPDALRHWTDSQKQLLKDHPAGQRLLELEQKQQSIWKERFQNSNSNLTWEQFEWAMEVVHSRAFCGQFDIGGSSSTSNILSVAAPIVAAAAGYFYVATLHGQSDAVLLGLGVAAVIPALVNLITQQSSSSSSGSAVLLPLIDSANHMEDADSRIDYSPLSGAFTLMVGPNCIRQESDGKDQLYISYGKKKDTELLLNYGFVKGIPLEGDGDDDSRRKHLAEAFLARQHAS